MAAADFTAPSIDYAALSPILIVTIAAVVGVLVDAFAPRALRWPLQVGVAIAGVAGMDLFPAANDLLMLFVALEVLSLPLYLMCGLARRRRLLSQEAAVKYFLLGAFSSAFFLYGLALLYGYVGKVADGVDPLAL